MSDAPAIAALLTRARFHFANEKELQDGIEIVLRRERVPFVREVRLGQNDRIDFLVDPSVGVEVKVDDPLAKVTRQLHRYSLSDAITSLILVTSRARHLDIPGEMSGKPIIICHLLWGSL